MAVQVKPEQSYAYSELLEILELMEVEYVNKIPKKLMKVFKENASTTYEKHIDANIPLEEQNISEKTSALIAMLTLNYWCDSKEQKQELLDIYKENEKKYQEELREKYNPDNIFNNEYESTKETKVEKTSSEIDYSDEELNSSSSDTSNEYSGISVEQISVDENNLPVDYNNFPWYKKVFTKFRNFIFKFFKNAKNPT